MGFLRIHKAGRVHESTEVGDLHIEATVEFPADPDSAACRELHEADGDTLSRALLASLPGGTVDRLLIRLLEHRASVLRVPYLR